MDLKNYAISTAKGSVVENIIPVLLGALVFFVVVGWDTLCFDNIRWLQQSDDSAQHYLGWLFYRYAPWAFPVGLNPNFGLEVSSSIFYSDSIPFLAIFFKLFSPFLPEPFQYFGLWYLLCFILQACFAFRLIGLIKDDLLIKVCATGLFLFAPPMLSRLVCHSALVGHWMVLAAIYFCLTEAHRSRKWQWLALATFASLTHAYLLAMVVILWMSDTVKRLVGRETKPWDIFYEYVLVFAGVFLALWQVGYFLLKSGRITTAYGVYKMNLLALINPLTSFPVKHSFSFIMPDLPVPRGEYEGFNYLGLGIIGLFLAILPQLLKKLRKPAVNPLWLPLVLVCLGLTIFAISNKVGIGNIEFTLWIPETIAGAASILRSSGRMFWPVFYLLLWGMLFLLINSYKRNTALLVLFFAFLAQSVDTWAGWGPTRPKSVDVAQSWYVDFKSPFWVDAALKYRKIRLFPPMFLSPIRFKVAYLAGINKMGTDAAYLARYDYDAQEKLKDYYDNIFKTGNYDKDTLYIYDESYVKYAPENLQKDNDLSAIVDGYYVVAPGWNKKH